MSAIPLLMVSVLWLIITFFLVKALGRVMPEIWWAYVLRAVLLLALLPLPLIDELVGKHQFERLCRENAGIQVDRARATGGTVSLSPQPTRDIEGTWVRVVVQPWRFVDVNTGETVVSYNTLQAVGGVFIRTLGISEGGVPLTFAGSCEPGGVVDPLKLFKELGITQVQRSAIGAKEQSK